MHDGLEGHFYVNILTLLVNVQRVENQTTAKPPFIVPPDIAKNFHKAKHLLGIPDSSSQPSSNALFLHPPPVPMVSPRPPKGRDGVLSTLNVLIQALDVAKDTCGILPAQVALGSASVLLTMIRVRLPLPIGGKLLTHIFPGYNDQRS
jgi:hypothetical protein